MSPSPKASSAAKQSKAVISEQPQPVAKSAVKAQASAKKPSSDGTAVAMQPCGPSLEYDAEYLLLQRRLEPVGEAQYGQFIDKPTEPDWAEIGRECERLLVRSKDITLYVWLARAELKLRGAFGLAEVFERMTETLEQYPDDVHPQLVIEGEHDPLVRANAMAALADPAGLLEDLRNLALSTNLVSALTVKEVERARSTPTQTDTAVRESVRLRLIEVDKINPSPLVALRRCYALALRLEAWNQANCDDQAVELKPLRQLLALFSDNHAAQSEQQNIAKNIAPGATNGVSAQHVDHSVADEFHLSNTSSVDIHTDGVAPVGLESTQIAAIETLAEALVTAPPPNAGHASLENHALQRERMKRIIQQTAGWFEQMEPSSPVGVLLNKAASLIGLPYVQVANVLPPEVLAHWAQESIPPNG